MSVFSFGADPEVFVVDRATKKFVPAWGLVGGTKYEPELVQDGAVQVDGMALEFNINPAKTENKFVKNIFSVKKQLGDMIGDDLQLSDVSTAVFDVDVWKKTPKEAKVLGCDPDFNAITMMQNTMPKPAPRFRTAGGHIHIGWGKNFDVGDPDFFNLCANVVRQLDASVGCYLYKHDPDRKRQSLYGAPGAFRVKPYGVEYRSPSNWWIRDEESTAKIFRIAKKAVEDLSEGVRYPDNLTRGLVLALEGDEEFKKYLEYYMEKDRYGVFNV